MKFYYNGQLIRTSKTHEYKYALLDHKGKCLTCSATLNAVQSYRDSEITKRQNSIKTSENLINALKTGASHFTAIEGRKTYRVKVDKDYWGHTVESAQENITACTANIERIRNSWQIVELEARA